MANRKIQIGNSTFSEIEKNMQKNTATVIHTPAFEITKAPVGRPSSKRTISRNNGSPVTVYLSNEQKEILSDASHFSKMDQADIIRTALEQFFSKYTDNNRLTNDGFKLVNAYVAKTTEDAEQ